VQFTNQDRLVQNRLVTHFNMAELQAPAKERTWLIKMMNDMQSALATVECEQGKNGADLQAPGAKSDKCIIMS
jgi:hypothetical protein